VHLMCLVILIWWWDGEKERDANASPDLRWVREKKNIKSCVGVKREKVMHRKS
jgi:hypothetical protein